MLWQILEHDWATSNFTAKPDSRALVSLEVDASYQFRDLTGKLVHRYALPQVHGFGALRPFADYAVRQYDRLNIGSVKLRLLNLLEAAIVKLAPLTDELRIFELGSSSGENYNFVREILQRYGFTCQVRFTGIDNCESLVTFARMIHHGDPDVFFIHGDGSDLSRFPDRCFDIVINHGVANYCDKPLRALAEVWRICRHMVVGSVLTTDRDEPFLGVAAGNLQGHLFITAAQFRELMSGPPGSVAEECHRYIVGVLDFNKVDCTGSTAGYFIDAGPGAAHLWMEYWILCRQPFFPELAIIHREGC